MRPSSLALVPTLALAASTFAACSGGGQTDMAAGSGGSGAPTASAATTASAGAGGAVVAMTDPPQVVNGVPPGPVLTAPKVQLIAYAEDPIAPDVEKMLVELTKTQTWAEQTAEYGVGPLTLLPTISIAGTPPATLDDDTGCPTPFEQTLASNLSGPSPVWGAADASTIYLFLLPDGTQVNSQGLCCDPTVGYYGYHYDTAVGAVDVPYAIVCNCPSLDGPPLTALQWVTTTVNHELAEAATNPRVQADPAFGQVDVAHAIWDVATFGGEVADMCQNNADENDIPPGSTYMVQRTWSNAAARAGTNPCVPVPPTGPYFNSYPTLPDMVTLTSGPITTRGVKIPVGESRTINVVLHSEAPTSGPWKVTVQDLSQYVGDTSKAATELTLDKSTGSDGDVLHLTIKVLSIDTTLGGEGFVISSTLGQQNNLWYGAVGQ